MKSGETLVEAVDVPTGDPRQEAALEDDIIDKFRANVGSREPCPRPIPSEP